VRNVHSVLATTHELFVSRGGSPAMFTPHSMGMCFTSPARTYIITLLPRERREFLFPHTHSTHSTTIPTRSRPLCLHSPFPLKDLHRHYNHTHTRSPTSTPTTLHLPLTQTHIFSLLRIRMISLATQKFIADIARDALQQCKHRQSGAQSKRGNRDVKDKVRVGGKKGNVRWCWNLCDV